jgi:hypothetical protein
VVCWSLKIALETVDVPLALTSKRLQKGCMEVGLIAVFTVNMLNKD